MHAKARLLPLLGGTLALALAQDGASPGIAPAQGAGVRRALPSDRETEQADFEHRVLELEAQFGTQTLQRALRMSERACTALAALQGRDGSFRLQPAENPAPVAVTALSALALLSFGHVPGRGEHGEVVERAVRYLLEQQRGPGEKAEGYIGSEADRYSKMHGHGYATTCLAQAYGMLPRGPEALVDARRLKSALERAVAIIASSQERQTGGWSYDPVPVDHEGSITICVVQALRACRDAGIHVDKGVIDRAVRYVERSQKPDGSIRYQLGSGNSSVALTAAAIATLQASGEYDNPHLVKALGFLLDEGDIWRDPGGVHAERKRFPFYERLYVGEALFSARELRHFRRWYPLVLEGFERTQDPGTGLWTSRQYSQAYATAMNLLVLSLPFQLLPIHQR